MEVDPDSVIMLDGPIFGFESYTRFALIPAPDAPPFVWLQSLEEKRLAFPVVSARELAVSYDVNDELLSRFAADNADEFDFWLIVTVPMDGGQLRVNLRAPLAVHRPSSTAAQVIMCDDYPIRRTLALEPRENNREATT